MYACEQYVQARVVYRKRDIGDREIMVVVEKNIQGRERMGE